MEKKQIVRVPPKNIEGFDIRYTVMEDGEAIKKWLEEKKILRYFPMYNEPEIDNAIQNWVGFCRYKASLTATINNEIVGIATLILQPYKKLFHQCMLSIIVSPDCRGKGVGTELLRNLIHLAKSKFNIELIHLEVYEGNPAKRLYERFGFKEFGFQKKWVKEPETGEYVGRHFLELELDRIELH